MDIDMHRSAPLTFGQESMFAAGITCPLIPPPICLSYRIRGELDVSVFLAAVETVVGRNQALRLRVFETPDGEVRQMCEPLVEEEHLIDLQFVQARSPSQFDDYARTILAQDFSAPWDAERDATFRFRFLRLDQFYHCFLATFQHIAFDGNSLALFEEQLWNYYRSHLPGEEIGGGPATNFDYLEAATHERRRYQSRANTVSTGYWEKKIEASPPYDQICGIVANPIRNPKEGTDSSSSDSFDVVGRPLEELRSRARHMGCSVAQLVLAAYAGALFTRTPNDRLVINTPISTRDRETRNVIGTFVSFLPLTIDRDADFYRIIESTKREMLTAAANRHVDGRLVWEQILKNRQRWGAARDNKISFNYLIVPQPVPGSAPGIAGLSLDRNVYNPSDYGTGSQLSLEATDRPDLLRVHITASFELTSDDSVCRLSYDIRNLLTKMASSTEVDFCRALTTNWVRNSDQHLSVMSDSANRSLLNLNLAEIEQTIRSASERIGNASVCIEKGNSGRAEVHASVEVDGWVDTVQVREKCFAASRNSRTVVAQTRIFVTSLNRRHDSLVDENCVALQTEPARTFLESCLRLLEPPTQAGVGFWEMGGTFAKIRIIVAEMNARGLEGPTVELFLDLLCIESLARIIAKSEAAAERLN
jgi:hypothetical protein